MTFGSIGMPNRLAANLLRLGLVQEAVVSITSAEGSCPWCDGIGSGIWAEKGFTQFLVFSS
jgi:hypothetical protein